MSNNASLGLSVEALRDIFVYHPDTGVVTWRFGIPSRKKSETWTPNTAGEKVHINRSGRYARIWFNKQGYYVHRIAFAYMVGHWPLMVDHVNQDKQDNRWSNLRECTTVENSHNRRSGKYGACGIRKCTKPNTKNPYRVCIVVNGNEINLGRFPTADLATAARRDAEKKYFGEFAPQA